MRREHFLLTFLLLWHCALARNLLDEIKGRPELSEIAKVLDGAKGYIKSIVQSEAFTAFMPTNEAMLKYDGPRGNELLQYHLVRSSLKIQDVETSLASFLTGNPRLYVTKRPSGKSSISGWEDYDYFINNAKVIHANFKLTGDPEGPGPGPTQYLHIIDEVLMPTIPRGPGRSGHSNYPNAKEVLQKPELYGFRDELSLRLFKDRVNELRLVDIFDRTGNSTFFLPVDDRMNPFLDSPDKTPIDKQVIYGHIVPNEVLFTRTSSDVMTPFKSLADSNTLKVFIKLTKTPKVESPKELVYYVESNTVKTDNTHMKGVARARIVKGNVPVKNGVLHLIDRPLMIIASSIAEVLQDEPGTVSEFYRLMKDFMPDILAQFSQDNRLLTLLAPSNEAFKKVNRERMERTKANSAELRKIINLHIVADSLTTDDMITTNGLFEKESMSSGRKLYFAVRNPNDFIPHVTVEGAGVNASIITPNVMAQNGAVHIIDRILGIPSQTVLEKLQSDPTLSSSYELIMQTKWKDEFSDPKRKFTFFVPNNDAWEQINRTMPSAHKKLFMKKYGQHISQIMERHLISNQALTLDDLIRRTTNKTRKPELAEERKEAELQMVRQKIYFAAQIRDNFGDYYVEWFEVTAGVKRADVECVNGVVHVIDKVLMREGDVTVNASNKMTGEVSTLASIIICVALAWSLI